VTRTSLEVTVPVEADATVSGLAQKAGQQLPSGTRETPGPTERSPERTQPPGGEQSGAGQSGGGKTEVSPLSRFAIPPELLPGGPVASVTLTGTPAEIQEKINRLFPPLGPLGEDPQPIPGPEGRPLTLADLHRLALSNSPLIKQAAANVQALRGAAIQAGLPPNPTMGYEEDTAGTTGGAGYQGGFFDQVIKTANKLQLARAVATMDLRNAELALRRAETDLLRTVRGAYFGVLVAQEGMRVNRALVRFAEEVYNAQVAQVRKGGFAAAYEPLYLRVLAVQARAALVQSRNRYTAAWKQLASALGLPGLPRTQLAGRVDMPIPIYDHQAVLAQALARHTDVLTAENTLLQARYRLKLARVTPIPDVEVRVMLQKDNTGLPFALNHSVQVGMPIPVWDRNQGGILQAEANVVQSTEEPHRVRAALSATLADAFERYQNNRVLLDYYRNEILPNQVRIYEGVYRRWNKDPAAGLNIGDISVAQQNLATGVTGYLSTLGLLWQAVVDVTDLLQTNDLFQVNGQPVPTECVPPLPDLEHLPALPCDHPCSPLPGLHQQPDRNGWPQAIPAPEARPAPAAEKYPVPPPGGPPPGKPAVLPPANLPAPKADG
jgi:cobalt-zinc-cadmium efflux system outer membrane protein